MVGSIQVRKFNQFDAQLTVIEKIPRNYPIILF